ncbi:MAG TPA: hypothetical protein VFS21_00335 [Roseiflexaceae bacterium]|nr:hypothetical protein [Roseiflexaceae bacterium]
MQLPIVLLGPFRAGKTTLAKLLAARLGLPQVSLDDVRWPYYEQIGYSHSLAQQLRERGGMLALVLYWQLFDAYSVERVLDDYPGAVIDMGAGIGIADSHEQFLRVQHALAPYRNVILVMPSPDPDTASTILDARDTNPPPDLNFDFRAHSLHHHGYYDLAKHTIYTGGKQPQACCDEILRIVLQ